MILDRKEAWGDIRYNTETHAFSYQEKAPTGACPYTHLPVVLNLVLTHQCNMTCRHCVARDFAPICTDDLRVTPKLVRHLNHSPFMVMVITGGEPLLPSCEEALCALLERLENKAGIVDTNGTIEPTKRVLRLLKQKEVLLRVSLDSMNPNDEVYLRHGRGGPNDKESISLYHDKIDRLRRLTRLGICTAAQTLVYRSSTTKRARDSVFDIINFLHEEGIEEWYLQRLIPSHRFRNPPDRSTLPSEKYAAVVARLASAAAQAGVRVFGKRDKRHNSVFLLVGDGALYTQGSAPGQKVPIGSIYDADAYDDCFTYVSAPDHAARYYCQTDD